MRVAGEVPSFLKRDLGSKDRIASRRTNLSASIASGLARVGGILRGHLEQDVPSFKGKDRAAGVGGAVLAVLSLLVIIVSAGALIAVNQIKSLKTEIATLERALAIKNRPQNRNQSRTRRTTKEMIEAGPVLTKAVAPRKVAPGSLRSTSRQKRSTSSRTTSSRLRWRIRLRYLLSMSVIP
jgi:hypothetical protein